METLPRALWRGVGRREMLCRVFRNKEVSKSSRLNTEYDTTWSTPHPEYKRVWMKGCDSTLSPNHLVVRSSVDKQKSASINQTWNHYYWFIVHKWNGLQFTTFKVSAQHSSSPLTLSRETIEIHDKQNEQGSTVCLCSLFRDKASFCFMLMMMIYKSVEWNLRFNEMGEK